MSSDKDLESIEQARELVERAHEAQTSLATFPQEKVDEIVGAMARAAQEDAHRLGEMAHLETGYGSAADKATKNRFSAEQIYNLICNLQDSDFHKGSRRRGVKPASVGHQLHKRNCPRDARGR